MKRVNLTALYEFLTKCRPLKGTETGAAPLEAVRRASERRAFSPRDGFQHGGYFARRVFEVQANQLDDQVWLALALNFFKAFEPGHFNRFKRRRISARAGLAPPRPRRRP